MKAENVSVVNGKIIGDTDKRERPIYGDPIFTAPDNDAVYDSRWAKDEKSTQVVSCLVPVLGAGFSVKLMIYGNLKTKDGDRECTFAATFPAKALKADSPDHKNAILAHVENAVLAWPFYEKATEAAYARLIAPPAAKSEGANKAAAKDTRPRLVHKSAVVPVAVPPAA